MPECACVHSPANRRTLTGKKSKAHANLQENFNEQPKLLSVSNKMKIAHVVTAAKETTQQHIPKMQRNTLTKHLRLAMWPANDHCRCWIELLLIALLTPASSMQSSNAIASGRKTNLGLIWIYSAASIRIQLSSIWICGDANIRIQLTFARLLLYNLFMYLEKCTNRPTAVSDQTQFLLSPGLDVCRNVAGGSVTHGIQIVGLSVLANVRYNCFPIPPPPAHNPPKHTDTSFAIVFTHHCACLCDGDKYKLFVLSHYDLVDVPQNCSWLL